MVLCCMGHTLGLLIVNLDVACQSILGSIVVSISACHAEDPGSIPGRGGHSFFSFFAQAFWILLGRVE